MKARPKWYQDWLAGLRPTESIDWCEACGGWGWVQTVSDVRDGTKTICPGCAGECGKPKPE